VTVLSDTSHQHAPGRAEPVALVDLLDRLLGTGVVLSGDIVISLVDVDLVRIQLWAVISSVRNELGQQP
jgi:hypothetical protein